MLGKNSTHFLRIIGILHFLRVSFEFVNDNEELAKNGLNNELNDKVDKFAKAKKYNIVTIESVKQAQQIIEYYNKNFFCLGGLAVSPTDSLEDVLKSLSNKLEAEPTETTDKLDEESRRNIKNALISPGGLVDHTYMRVHHRVNKEPAQKLFELMQNLGLGKLSECGTSQKPCVFSKITEHDVKENIQISKVFKEIGLNTSAYFNNLNKKHEVKIDKKGKKSFFFFSCFAYIFN